MNVGFPCSACGRSHASHVCRLCPDPELLCSRCSVLTPRGVRCIPHVQQRSRLRLIKGEGAWPPVSAVSKEALR